MNDNNKLPKQAKQQEFELIELLFREYISSHIARPNIEYSFQARFQSFINQIQSYLHSSSKTGFFTHFFFGSFASLLDTKLAEELGIRKLHFNFDSIDHLRIVAEAGDKTHIFIYIENNQKQKHNKKKKICFTKDEWKKITGQEYTDDANKKLEINVININKSRGSINVTVEKKNIQDGESSTKQYHEMMKQFVNEDGQYIVLEDQILKFSVGKKDQSEEAIKLILNYTKKIHDHYLGLPYGDGAREADEHGFVVGIFNNFRYRENAHVYLEQFAGKGYADIVLLVRGANRSTKSIPIIIELKAGIGPGKNADDALTQVEEYTKGFQPNNMRILSLSDHILCVGMNLDMPIDSFIQTRVVARDQEIIPLMQAILDAVEKTKINNLDIIKQKIQNQLENTYNTFPGTGEKSSAHYMSRFILGESLVLRKYDKHIFIYDKESYIPTATVIDDHNTRSSKKPRIERTLDGSNAVNSILFIPISSADSPVILVNIIDVNRDIIVNNIRLDSGLIGDRKIVQLNIKFNIDKYKESFKEYCNIQLLKIYASISEYNQVSIQVKGKLHLVAEDVSDNLLEYLQQAISSQKGLVIAESHYKKLLAKVGEIVYPIKSLIGKESEFQGLLEGIFKYYSNVKLSEGSERRELVLTEFQTGAGSRIDMLVQAIGSSNQGTTEYTPVGLELKYDYSIKLNAFAKKQDQSIQQLLLVYKEKQAVEKLLTKQIKLYAKGAAIKSITDSNQLVIIGIVFNAQAEKADSLLLTVDKFTHATVVHSSKLYTIRDINDKQDQLQGTTTIHRNSIIMENLDTIDVSQIEALARLLDNNADIQKIAILNSEITDDAMARLSNVLLQNNNMITSIRFKNTNLDSTKAEKLINLLQKNKHIVDMDITSNNNLDIESQNKINNLLHRNQRIYKKIKSTFASYAIDDMSLDVFIPDWVNIRLDQIRDNNIIVENSDDVDHCYQDTALDLSNTMLEDSKIDTVVTWLKEHQDVDFLDLSNNKLSSVGVEKILQYFIGTQNKLSLLDISENDIGTNNQAIARLADLIKYNNNVHAPVLKFLNMHNIEIQYEDIHNIFRALVQNTSIEHLDISSNDVFSQIQKHDIQYIANTIVYILCHHPVLSTLNLSNTGLTNLVIKDLVRVQQIYFQNYHFTHITELNIASNHITQDGIESLVQLISCARQLQSLDISDNHIGQQNIHQLLNNLRDTKISRLSMSNTDLNNAQNIGNVITNSNIQILDISHNNIGTKAVIDIFQAISDRMKREDNILIQLNLSGNTIELNNIRQEEVITAMCEALDNNDVLRSLDISDMNIQDTFLSKLAVQLVTSDIEHLNISGNDISEFTISCLVSYLMLNPPLRLLNISATSRTEYQSLIREQDIYNLFQALSGNSKLTHLNLSYNNLDHTSITIISQYLKKNHALEYLDLAYTNLSMESIYVLFQGLSSNNQLQYLDIRNSQQIDDDTALKILEILKLNRGLKILHISQQDLSRDLISKFTRELLDITVEIDGYMPLKDNLMHQNNNLLDLEYQTFESATKSKKYDYWLQMHDILDIGRVHYEFRDNGLEVVGSIDQLSKVINNYKSNSNNISLFTIICNIGDDNKGSNHWVSLVLNRQNTNYHGYYVDSFGRAIPSNIASILNNAQILIVPLSILQQLDGHNCGLWALENAQTICRALQNNAGTDLNTDILRDTSSRSAYEWCRIRDNVYAQLIHDNIRIESLRILGLTQHYVSVLDSQESIISACLSSTLRMKREVKQKCKIGWSDIDAISVNNPSRNIEEIVIDAKKFLEYDKLHVEDEQKSWQLIRLVKEIKNKGGVRIVGEYQGLLEQVIQDGGYNNYIQKSRISAIGHHIIKKNNQISSSPALQLKLINVAGQIQLISGVHAIIVLCQDDLTSNDCMLSASALGYSFLAQPLEMLMVQVIRPMITKHTATVANKLIPKVVLYDAKVVVQILSVQYGAKIAKGTAGAITGLFDVIDIVRSSEVLIACSERTNANPCSSKEIRDNIASIGFSGVSFISGIMVRGPHGLAIGLVLLVAQRTYSGISNIIEYEEKYDTTIGEDLSIFWRTALLRSMARDVVSLQYRSDNMNNIVHEIAQYLRNNTHNVVGYSIGLGRIELEYKPLCQKKTVKVPVYCIGLRPASGPCAYGKDGYIEQNQTVCDIRSQYIPSMVQDLSFINAKYTSTDHTNTLSRVLPKPVDKMKMVCLPQATNAEYEKGIKNTRIDAQYYCDNALIVMSDDQNHKVNLKNQYILYNLQYIEVGAIFASNIYHNRFLMNNGTINISGGDNVKNEFIFLSNEFLGTIFLGVNSTNIIDTSQLQDVVINFTIKNLYSRADFSHAILNGALIVQHHNSNDINLNYTGRKNKIDNIVCDVFGNTLINNTMKYYAPISSILIDGGGGYNDTHEDLIRNCNIVMIKPYTRVQGINSSYTFYIPTKQYANQSLNSTIDVYGNGTIIFPNIRLLRDSIITYASINNTLSCKILIDNGTYTIDIINYLNRYNKAQFVLIDQDSTNTIYQHTINNNQIIRHFSLYIECQFTTRQEVVNHYRTIAYSKEDYTVFGTVKNKQYNHLLKFGSSGKDIIIIDQNIVYVEGKENNDIYIVQHNTNSVYINNKAEDLKLDILQLPINSTNTILVIKNNENLHLIFNITIDKLQNHQYIQQEVIIEQYFQGNIYQHIAVMDLSNNTFIPFDTKNSEVKLLSFYHASTVRNIWVLPSNIQNAVLDITRDNIIFYRKGNDVLLTEKQTYAFNSLNIILKDYYIEQNQWSNVSLYSYNNSIKGIIDLYNIEISAISYQDLHDSVIQEYAIDTTKESQEIQHNQERLGVVIFQNMSFDRLEVTARNNNLVLLDSIDNNKEILIIKNWYKHNKYKSVMFEFSSGLEPDRIYISDRIEKKINFNNKLSKEILNIGNNVVKSVISYLILTCDQQATLAQRLTYSFLKASSSDLSLEEIKQNINTTISARALVLLAAKAYNKLLLKYDIEKKNILQNSCFSTVLLPLKIQEIIQYVDSTDLSQIEQFIHKNTHEIYSITTSNIPLLNDSHKHRHHHGEHVAHHRGRRDIDHAWEIAAVQDDHNDDLIDLRDDILEVSSADSSLTPWGYNIVNWIRNNILLTFKDIDPLGLVKNLWNVYNDNTNTTVYDLDVSDNLGYRDSKNQDAVVDKFTMMQKINSKISELEERKIEVTKLLRALYQKLNRKLDIQKQEVDTAKINNDVEKIKQSIQDNELLNRHYTREIQMLKKEQWWGDTITDIYYEDRIKYLKEQIKSCEEEDIRLNNALQALEAQKTEDYTESSLVRERIFQLVRPLNIEEAKILREEDGLAIMHKNQQEQQQEIYHIKDQIELQKSLIENLRCELNALNQELAMLNVEDNNLSLHYELPYWNGSLEKNVEVDYDIADQLPLSISSSHHINVGNLSNLFIGNDTDKNQVLDDSLYDFQGTVSLWNLLIRKKYGVHYNHQHDMIQSKEINTEYAHRLAYSAAYALNAEVNEENLELLGTSLDC